MKAFRRHLSPRVRAAALALALLLAVPLLSAASGTMNTADCSVPDASNPASANGQTPQVTAEAVADMARALTPASRQELLRLLGVYNPLDGKTLVAAGDSLTAGYGIPADPKTGVIPTYPMLVGCRNRMNVQNLAINGAWMTSGRYSGGDVDGFSSYFDNPGFLPEEMDYLTINLGANDWSYGVLGLMDDYCLQRFGTIFFESTEVQRNEAQAAEDWIAKFTGSETDTGVTTWLGAWNTVLSYLRAHYPETKVGILVSYPCQDAEGAFAARLRETLFRIATKYGVPALDCGNPNEWFCIGYSEGLDPQTGDLIAETYTIDRCHPNALGHERMADSYEAWLKRL